MCVYGCWFRKWPVGPYNINGTRSPLRTARGTVLAVRSVLLGEKNNPIGKRYVDMWKACPLTHLITCVCNANDLTPPRNLCELWCPTVRSKNEIG
jgi:hypothetical protein